VVFGKDSGFRLKLRAVLPKNAGEHHVLARRTGSVSADMSPAGEVRPLRRLLTDPPLDLLEADFPA